MKNNLIYLYLLDTMADWEPGYTIAELNSGRMFKKGSDKYEVKTVGSTREPVVTMGGVTIVPDLTIDELDLNKAALMILPGGDTWRDPRHEGILDIVRIFLSSGVIVAAICGATELLAQAGILNNYRHTSNDVGYLEQTCPGYLGKDLYVQEGAVSDRNLITASGLAPLEFAREIFTALGVMKAETIGAWFNLHKTRDPQYYFKLVASGQE